MASVVRYRHELCRAGMPCHTLTPPKPRPAGHPPGWQLGALVLLVAFGLRLIQLGAGSIWYDESVSLYLAGLDLPAMVAHTAGDIHPPLYYALLHLWTLAAGTTEFSAAFFSLFFGLLLVALTQRVASTAGGRRRGLARGAAGGHLPLQRLVLPRNPHVHPGQLPGAAQHILSCSGCWTASARSLTGRPAQCLDRLCPVGGRRHLLALLLLLPAGLPEPVRRRPAPGHGQPALGRPRPGRRPALRRWLFAQAALLVLYLPWLPVAFRQATQPPVPPWRGFTAPWDAAGGELDGPDPGPVRRPRHPVAPPPRPGGRLRPGRRLAGRRQEPADWPPAAASRPPPSLVGYTLVPLAIILAISAFIPLYHVRYVFTYAAAFYIVLAAGLDRLRRWRGAALAARAGGPRRRLRALPARLLHQPGLRRRRSSRGRPLHRRSLAAGRRHPDQRRLRLPGRALLLRRRHRLARPAPRLRCSAQRRPARYCCRPAPSADRHSSAGAAPRRTSTPPPRPR